MFTADHNQNEYFADSDSDQMYYYHFCSFFWNELLILASCLIPSSIPSNVSDLRLKDKKEHVRCWCWWSSWWDENTSLLFLWFEASFTITHSVPHFIITITIIIILSPLFNHSIRWWAAITFHMITISCSISQKGWWSSSWWESLILVWIWHAGPEHLVMKIHLNIIIFSWLWSIMSCIFNQMLELLCEFMKRGENIPVDTLWMIIQHIHLYLNTLFLILSLSLSSSLYHRTPWASHDVFFIKWIIIYSFPFIWTKIMEWTFTSFLPLIVL